MHYVSTTVWQQTGTNSATFNNFPCSICRTTQHVTCSPGLSNEHVTKALKFTAARHPPRVENKPRSGSCTVWSLSGLWGCCVQTAMRVWDSLLCEGPKILYRVSLALLKTNEGLLMQVIPLFPPRTRVYRSRSARVCGPVLAQEGGEWHHRNRVVVRGAVVPVLTLEHASQTQLRSAIGCNALNHLVFQQQYSLPFEPCTCIQCM